MHAARELLLEHFGPERPRTARFSEAFAFLNPAAVAERAGVARSAFYHHWGKAVAGETEGTTAFDRFVDELWTDQWGPAVADTVTDAALRFRGPIDEGVRMLADLEFHRYSTPESWATWKAGVALAVYGAGGERKLEELNRQQAELYVVLLEGWGRRMRAGLSEHDLAIAISAILDGFWLRRVFGAPDPPVVDLGGSDVPQPVSLAAQSVWAVVDLFTEPVSGAIGEDE
jgi:AcrR family transcriptional regulator